MIFQLIRIFNLISISNLNVKKINPYLNIIYKYDDNILFKTAAVRMGWSECIVTGSQSVTVVAVIILCHEEGLTDSKRRV